jgi:hypothetical protein
LQRQCCTMLRVDCVAFLNEHSLKSDKNPPAPVSIVQLLQTAFPGQS